MNEFMVVKNRNTINNNINICVEKQGWRWCYRVRKRNLSKSLEKLVKKEVDIVWLKPSDSYYWLMMDKETLEKLLNGEKVRIIYHTEHPFFDGVKAYGYGYTSLQTLLS